MATAVSSGMAGALSVAADSSWMRILPTCGPFPWATTISYLSASSAMILPTSFAIFFCASAVASPFFCKALPPSANTIRFLTINIL